MSDTHVVYMEFFVANIECENILMFDFCEQAVRSQKGGAGLEGPHVRLFGVKQDSREVTWQNLARYGRMTVILRKSQDPST